MSKQKYYKTLYDGLDGKLYAIVEFKKNPYIYQKQYSFPPTETGSSGFMADIKKNFREALLIAIENALFKHIQHGGKSGDQFTVINAYVYYSGGSRYKLKTRILRHKRVQTIYRDNKVYSNQEYTPINKKYNEFNDVGTIDKRTRYKPIIKAKNKKK